MSTLYYGALGADIVFHLLVRETTFACRYLDTGELPFTDELVDGAGTYAEEGSDFRDRHEALRVTPAAIMSSRVFMSCRHRLALSTFMGEPVILPQRAMPVPVSKVKRPVVVRDHGATNRVRLSFSPISLGSMALTSPQRLRGTLLLPIRRMVLGLQSRNWRNSRTFDVCPSG